MQDNVNLEVLKDGEYTTFRGKPLVRDKNVICYGDMQNDAYVLFLMILSNKTVKTAEGEIEMPDQILCQINSTDTTLDAMARVRKSFQANGLFQALDIGIDHLDRYNKPKK